MSSFGRTLKRVVIVAVAIVVVLLLVIVLLDFFGDQPQPFQYLLH